MNVIAYLRCSTREQADSGAGLAAQRSAIQAEADRRGWTVVRWIEDAGESGKSLDRPGIQQALAMLRPPRRKTREADGLVVAKLDRASRSTRDFAELMETADRQRWAFVALDLAIDTSTPSGEFMAHIMAGLARWERRVISQRTKDALAESDKPLGRKRQATDDAVVRIIRDRKAGLSFAAIASALDADAVPTPMPNAARWYPSTVARIYQKAS